MRSGMVIEVRDVEEARARFPVLVPFVQAGLRSFVHAPLVTRDQVIGAIHFGSRKLGAYGQEHLRLLQGVSSQLAGAVANARLYAERTELEQQLVHSQKMEAIGRLAGGVAHDFNNLLTPILGYAQVGMRAVPPTERAHVQLQRIYDAAERASNLVRQLLTFSRKEIIEPRAMSLSRLIVDVDGILRRIIGENIELITRPKSALGLALMDPGQMEQVLVNLAVNARDAMPDGGRIIIETEDVVVGNEALPHQGMPPGQYVRMSVRDNGVGISSDVKDRIFDPFFTTKGIGQGTGLGLSTCYGIINQIGGYIYVDSEPGQGTTFTIYLPRVEGTHEDGPDVAEQRPLPIGGAETVLLVEDELAVREIASYVLREQGYTVLEAATGMEALSVFQGQADGRADLLLTDVVMPGMGGKELAERVRSMHPDVRVLYFSGYTNDTLAHHGVTETGDAVLQKPFRPEELARKVREVLRR